MATTRVRDIVSIASRLTKIPERDIMGLARYRHIVMVRQAVYFVAWRQGVHTYPMIGRIMDRDHSTVIHGVQVASDRVARDPEYAYLIERIEQECEAATPFATGRNDAFEFVEAYAKKAPRPKQLRPMFAVAPEENDPALRFNVMMEAGSRDLLKAIYAARA